MNESPTRAETTIIIKITRNIFLPFESAKLHTKMLLNYGFQSAVKKKNIASINRFMVISNNLNKL